MFHRTSILLAVALAVPGAAAAVGGDAETASVEALKRDPDPLGARYFLGEAALKRGDKAGAAAVWGPLIAALEPNDPRRADLQQRLGGAG